MGLKQESISSILLLGMLAGCSSATPHPTPFAREFETYLSLPPVKVFVIAGDPEGKFVLGYGYHCLSEIEAQWRAMEQCNVRKKELSTPAECVVYANGNEVVWQGHPEGAAHGAPAERP